MQTPQFLQGIPRIAYIVAAPIAIFLVTVVVVMATSGGGDDDEPDLAINPTVAPSLDNLDAPPTATSTAPPTPTATATTEPTPAPAANREDCNAIQGTAYESPEEREWYLANCLGGGQTASEGTGGGGGGGGGASGVEYALGATLSIPSIGLNATVTGMDVGGNGAMPDPTGYFNAVQYNFPNHPGLGGSNRVLAGHVDCAACNGGGPGTAVFYSIRNLSVGATAQYYAADGSVTNYVVVSSYSVSDGTDFSGIVSSGAAGMTLITCTGTFGGGHYDQRHVVAFAAQ